MKDDCFRGSVRLPVCWPVPPYLWDDLLLMDQGIGLNSYCLFPCVATVSHIAAEDVRACGKAHLAVSASSAPDPRRSAVLPNGSPLNRSLPQFLKTEQHGQHTFKLAVEVDLVAEPLLRNKPKRRLPLSHCQVARFTQGGSKNPS
jgi:hypothetical protein